MHEHTFVLPFDPAEIRSLAGRFGATADVDAKQAGAMARHRGYYTAEEFMVVCRWKSIRSAGRAAANRPDGCSTAFSLRYLDACRRLAAESHVDLRTLDKALWQHSRERAGL